MLVYTTDQDPGITRKGAGTGFYYLDAEGNKVEDDEVLERIRSLAIPPAYREVWICPLINGHLQATGYDQRQRKQYRYHPEWQKSQNTNKFARLPEVGEGLPRLRRRIREDLKDFSCRKCEVVAGAVRIIDKLGLRVGNRRYLEENQTRGVSTLSEDNVRMDGEAALDIEYVAKGGKRVRAHLHDALLANAVEECHELGGQDLFTYQGIDGKIHSINSADINRYLKEVYQSEVSAKDLRTWRASAETLDYLRKIRKPEDREAEIRDAIRHAAEEIQNRYATCRKHYVHPRILEAYRESSSAGFSRLRIEDRPELQKAESLLLRILAA
ncbi:MAG: hypothetical protein R3242_09600 [Akkermansiaceae bacterium]|nr:hypothetical protein [Akkermansiaceae bacterium]